MKTEKIIRLRVSLSLEFKAPKLVKVKAYQGFGPPFFYKRGF